jgi:4-diphosphocytidyl-2-C-methyl-D-erythritol kinase
MSATNDAPPQRVVVRCPAKINLHLRVGPARSDGFHPLLTWMCTVGLFDMLEMWLNGDAPPAVRLTCNPSSLPSDERNLVVRIVNGWAKERATIGGIETSFRTIDATLTKRVPLGAGLGGGSSDAAGALLAAERLWVAASEPRSAEVLSAFAARFGSDTPFFFQTPSAICTGRGEIVRPIGAPAAKAALLVLPPIVMPTPEVYRRFDAMGLERSRDVEEEADWQHWMTLPAAELMANLVNDLEPPAMALRPELQDLRRRIEGICRQTVRMSGSGSSLFTLYDTVVEANAVKEEVRRELKENGTRVEAVDVGPPLEIQ